MATDLDVAFPTLGPRDLDALEARGHPRDVRAGDVLFAAGDRHFCFYAIRQGSIEIVEQSSGEPRSVATHHAGQFTGDVDMLSGRVALVTARAAEDGRVIELSAEELRRAVDELPELGETIIKAFLTRRQLLISGGFVGIRIIGSRFSPAAHRLRDFAVRNAIPFTFQDLETDEQADALIRGLGIAAAETPIVLTRDGHLVRNPSIAAFASCAGLTIEMDDDQVHDLVVVGAGPAGLAASVYAASEGLEVLTVEALAAGGQAGTSTRIENYLGFPAGISGADLTRNALLQAQRFGARITVPAMVRSLGIDGGEHVVTLTDGTRLRTRCVLVASGVAYRKLDVDGFARFEGAGIYYAATDMEARLCRGEEVVVVGGGNSAGQAVVYLAKYARHVHVLIRGKALGGGMSRYLVDRLEGLENVTILTETTVTGLAGDDRLNEVHATGADGTRRTFETSSLFLFIGADANTSWLRGCVGLDRKGFVLTGTSLPGGTAELERWQAVGRAPFLLETTLPGVFAAGDVRSGSVKRVASAVGEGAMAVSFVHTYIARPV
ncbi:MAG: FAD-dependent oxidoreductase [Gemmatimonadales bacterium]